MTVHLSRLARRLQCCDAPEILMAIPTTTYNYLGQLKLRISMGNHIKSLEVIIVLVKQWIIFINQ
ncbi:hypothetical protein AtNW77_Chr2g0234121 [Arabidopsis thaliana]